MGAHGVHMGHTLTHMGEHGAHVDCKFLEKPL
jgi:hypothetical protein